MKKQEEVRREVLAVVLLLIIFAAVLGTWTVLEVIDELRDVKDLAQSAYSTSVSVGITGAEKPITYEVDS